MNSRSHCAVENRSVVSDVSTQTGFCHELVRAGVGFKQRAMLQSCVSTPHPNHAPAAPR